VAVRIHYEAVKIFMPANREKPVIVPYVEHVSPDVTAWKWRRGADAWLRENGGQSRFFSFGVLVCGAVTKSIGADMPKGTVKWFNSQKGYGFIQPQGGTRDVFVHISAVERAGLSSLNEGQVVEYEEVSNRGKTSAENLRVQRWVLLRARQPTTIASMRLLAFAFSHMP
jgi:cold shock protein